jgi:hypothetical protein
MRHLHNLFLLGDIFSIVLRPTLRTWSSPQRFSKLNHEHITLRSCPLVLHVCFVSGSRHVQAYRVTLHRWYRFNVLDVCPHMPSFDWSYFKIAFCNKTCPNSKRSQPHNYKRHQAITLTTSNAEKFTVGKCRILTYIPRVFVLKTSYACPKENNVFLSLVFHASVI